jgi:uncharacterized protein YoxC
MPKIDNQILELALFSLVALAMVVQAFALLATFFAMRKAARSMDRKIEEMRSSVMPIINSSRNLLTKLGPKIESTSEDLAAITRSLRVQTADLESATADIASRAKWQAARIDSMLSSVFDSMDRAGSFLADTVNKPIRQVSALLASVKAAIESLRTSVPASRPQSNHVPGDNDIFVENVPGNSRSVE